MIFVRPWRPEINIGEAELTVGSSITLFPSACVLSSRPQTLVRVGVR